jgi:hypothetical protein
MTIAPVLEFPTRRMIAETPVPSGARKPLVPYGASIPDHALEIIPGQLQDRGIFLVHQPPTAQNS